MDQMPTPMAKAPRISQARPAEPFDSATRAASPSAVYDTRMATAMESATSPEL